MSSVDEYDFRCLVDFNPKAVMLATDEPRILYVNRAFKRITGYEEGQVLGQKPSLLSSGLHDAGFYDAMWRSLKEEGRWQGVIWNRRRDGDVYPQWLTIYSLPGNGELRYAGVFADVGDVAGFDEQLTALAYYDPLTELPNRYLFKEFLDAWVSQRRCWEKSFSVLFIDLDYFKEINDLHGHAVGDELLRMVAQRIRQVLRKRDVVARLSGDEFAAIVETTRSEEEIEQICLRMMHAFRPPFLIENREHFVSISVGSASYSDDVQSGADILQRADKAMYAAKTAGRACYRAYDSEISAAIQHHRRISECLVISLNTAPQEFSVVYQPQFDLATGCVVGLEALIRWNHPELGAVPPDEFVTVAENRGLAPQLSECLVTAILKDLLGGGLNIPAGLNLAVNISSRQIGDDALNHTLRPLLLLLERIGWNLELEITETHLMHLAPEAVIALRELGDKGIRIAIDDFGTGYSSLAYLHRLPVHSLKIDRQFVDLIDACHGDNQIVSAIIALADALQLDVVAEGIEMMGQLNALKHMGCGCGQGYLLAKPMPWGEQLFQIFDAGQNLFE